MEFHPYEPFDQNKAQKTVWEKLKSAFKDEEGVAFYRYPIFNRNGNLHREPDILLVHREYGLWVIECKGCYINNIASIQGHEWKMNDWHSEVETPVAQAEDQMFAIKNRLTERRETRGLVSFNFRVVLPFVKYEEWQSRGLDNFPSTQGVVLLAEDLTPKTFREKIIEGDKQNPQTMMTDEQWEMVKAVLGGTLPSKPPRSVPTGTPSNNPIRVIQAIESKLKVLDEQQQKVAFEIPDGAQRIRGLAGTGKTVLFAKRIAKMHARNPDWKLAFVFFTQALYDEITERIALEYRGMTGEEPNWINLKILHAWGTKSREGFYRSLALKCGVNPKSLNDVKNEIGATSPAKSFEYICDRLEQDVKNIPVIYDAVLIDEGQDLPPSFYRLVRSTLSDPRRLYWAYDEAQGIGSLIVPQPVTIFGKNPDGTPVVDLGGNKLPNGDITPPVYEGGIRKAHNMNRCYRTPRQLLMTAHAINMGLFRQERALQGVTNKEEWEKLGYQVLDGDFTDASVKAGKKVTITRPDKNSPHPIDQENFEAKDAVGSPLVIQPFASEHSEQKWIAQQVADDLKLGFDPCDIIITGPSGDNENNYFQSLQEALRKHGVKSCIAGVDTPRDIFRMDGYVTISNIFRAKGNEAWKVYACRFDYATKPLSWKQEREIHKRNEAFVALTRARVWCVVTGLDSPIFDELQKALEKYPNFAFTAFNKKTIERNNDENDDTEEMKTQTKLPLLV
ncbi:NERD domain-containing protein [Nostoc sp. FACHB-888]|uniref:NERD domain-containing protein n=1 Tax=Nostoc sp. FACHB-888 TaxID=2692842 RepID=UPI0016874B54|nr:NERD domain-containing protein [Nostoc sp. FACHB-888]MBD2246786.1 NERD domain-containing protein [Nostoc sp. FACHB-888]